MPDEEIPNSSHGESSRWRPNQTSFWEGQPHLRQAQDEMGFDPDRDLITSKDEIGVGLQERLETENVPSRFRKWQLPFSLYEPSNVYLTAGEPDARVDEHAHTEGAGYRIILDGSLMINGQELARGDWIYVPKGHAYSYEVGPRGVLVAAGYSC